MGPAATDPYGKEFIACQDNSHDMTGLQRLLADQRYVLREQCKLRAQYTAILGHTYIIELRGNSPEELIHPRDMNQRVLKSACEVGR